MAAGAAKGPTACPSFRPEAPAHPHEYPHPTEHTHQFTRRIPAVIEYGDVTAMPRRGQHLPCESHVHDLCQDEHEPAPRSFHNSINPVGQFTDKRLARHTGAVRPRPSVQIGVDVDPDHAPAHVAKPVLLQNRIDPIDVRNPLHKRGVGVKREPSIVHADLAKQLRRSFFAHVDVVAVPAHETGKTPPPETVQRADTDQETHQLLPAKLCHGHEEDQLDQEIEQGIEQLDVENDPVRDQDHVATHNRKQRGKPEEP